MGITNIAFQFVVCDEAQPDKVPPSVQKKMKAEQSDGEESDDIDESNDDNEMATSPKGSGVLPPPGEEGFL
ncbi:hypothetical protein FAUST_8391 [Fusarium austroamericanum]|uniref:Uncharacterized protein n=1 Tax=Fusarium austroamericanum TaxID=282268 RepID=A0AAN5Z506_FUSAU|nr:hypothetical protein FAUST_8391 [Fusarium austroamericanum]